MAKTKNKAGKPAEVVGDAMVLNYFFVETFSRLFTLESELTASASELTATGVKIANNWINHQFAIWCNEQLKAFIQLGGSEESMTAISLRCCRDRHLTAAGMTMEDLESDTTSAEIEARATDKVAA
ncbi:hypothetical protein KC926_01745 [Candidatus Kaiserbacteria bacterium]|nr:hypothetical protein [Candidatus Kaiserbacteria bacterium]